jgi:hypothetical protein
MSSRKTNTRRNTNTTRKVTREVEREVFDPSQHDGGVYERQHRTRYVGMRIRRGDTRHGDTSNVVLWRNGSRRLKLSLAEARAFKAFLDRELNVMAR